MSLKLVTPLGTEPVSLEEIKDQCRIDQDETAQDGLLMAHAIAARQWLEQVTALSFGPQTFELVLDAFPADRRAIRLPRAPLISVEHVQYVDTDGTTQTWDTADYAVDDTSVLPRIAPAEGECYPTTQDRINAVTVRFAAGYASGDSPETETLPEALKHALLLKTQALYDGTDLDKTIDALIGPYRAWGF